jgi:hypothetical protein
MARRVLELAASRDPEALDAAHGLAAIVLANGEVQSTSHCAWVALEADPRVHHGVGDLPGRAFDWRRSAKPRKPSICLSVRHTIAASSQTCF